MNEVLYATAGHAATITINRPAARNAMNESVISGLLVGLETARADADVRVVVLTGAGDVAFCAGADLKSGVTGATASASAIAAHHQRGDLARVFVAMNRLGKPIVARVNGHALAGGFGLACACDILIASTSATFGAPEINVGLWPMMISAVLIRAMPPKVALDLMMTGRRLSAEDALALGIVSRVVAPDALDDATADLVATLAAKSPVLMRLGRDAFYQILGRDFEDSLGYLQSQLTITTLSEDAAEGVRAFAEKRDPVWRNR